MSHATEFFAPLRPRPKQRVRVGKNGGRTPKKTREYESALALLAAVAKGSEPAFQGRIKAVIRLILPWPKTPKYRFPIHQRDGDSTNHAKAVEDALNKILYSDDRQICDLQVTKSFPKKGEEIGVFISVLETHSIEDCRYETPR